MGHEMAEFRITTDLTTVKQQIIGANFDEVKAWLQENLAPYVDMVVQEEDVPAAKTYRANIRKVRDRIDECRKEAKAAALAPYQDFELRAKQLTWLCDNAANALDIQIKVFEDKEADAKVEQLRVFYETAIGAQDEIVRNCLSWESVENPKWRNKTFSAETAKKEIADAIERTVTDIYAIGEMGARDPSYLLDYYKETHNLALVLKKASELDHIRQLEDAKGRDEQKDDERIGGPAEIVTVSFSVTCSKKKLKALAEYMRLNGIKYGRVPEKE